MRFIKNWRAFVAATFFCVYAVAASADAADDYIRSFMARSHAPGVSLAVVKDGKVVKAASYGYANLEWQVAATPTTLFWLDSLTKLFTAVGVLELAEQHKLTLDDPLSKFLPDTPPAWKEVTLRHLLSYTSGIKDDYWQKYQGSYLVDYDDKDIYAYAAKQPLVAAPGSQYAYNNESYYLLGVVIAHVTGVPYTRWITEHVLKPAGMKTAVMYNPWSVVPQMASSYTMKDGQLVHNRADIASDRGEAISSWGLYASLDDMIAFDLALHSGKLIAPADVALLLQNVRLSTGAVSASGLAFDQVMFVRGRRLAYKSGAAGVKYTTWPDDGITVILLTNMDCHDSGWIAWYQPGDIARLFDPRIQSMSTLSLHRDPDPARTQRILQASRDVANGVSPSPFLNPAFDAGITPEIRAGAKAHLPAVEHMRFLACDPVSSADPSRAVRYCHYRVAAGDGAVDLSFGLDRADRLTAVQAQME